MLAFAVTISSCGVSVENPPVYQRLVGGVYTPPPAGSACQIDATKICASAKDAGTLETPQAASSVYGMNAASMPSTARVEVPSGPTVQAMCYYNPQHTALARADFNVNGTVDDKAASYLQSKGFCQ